MGSGRTRPCLMPCEDAEGEESEAVVKLRGHPQLAPGAMMAEAMCSLLASDLGLPVQQPYQVQIDRDFAATVPDPALRPIIEASAGLNFGSRKWGPGYSIWPRDQNIPRAMRQTAMEIFAFDGLIQNPDRRAINPNCVFLGDDYLLYDHEVAFSNLLALFAKPPWEAGGLDVLKDHIFRDVLRGQSLELDRLQGTLEALDASRFHAYAEAIPAEWDGQAITRDKAAEHILNCIPNFDRIKLQLQSLP
ncbi:MAG: HipA family kinase [Akkermansiaceae bacterium]